jgi:Cu-Zn family superoxide dismutase
MNKKSDAKALITGKGMYKEIIGKAYFYNTKNGVLVVIEVNELPQGKGRCNGRIFGVHIHEGYSCTGNEKDMYANTMGHYNPDMCMHPYHAGDMPPLFENNGHAFMMFLTDRFKVNEIIGKTIVIHGKPDDYNTQPSGDSGNKIACGVIESM